MPISDAQQTQSQRRPPLLEFNDVNTYYGELHVLKGVNYRVGDGEIVCLLGGNASGKSTTMKTILGIVKPKTGLVIYGGSTINDLPTAERVKRGIAPVPESRRLFPRMTVLENLEMGALTRSDTIDIEADIFAWILGIDRLIAGRVRVDRVHQGLALPLRIFRLQCLASRRRCLRRDRYPQCQRQDRNHRAQRGFEP